MASENRNPSPRARAARIARHPRSWFALLISLLALVNGCPLAPSSPEEAKAVREEPKALEPGQTATFEFEADGHWHNSPWLALEGQSLVIKPGENAQAIAKEALRFKIAGMPQVITPDQPFSITWPGRISFRVEPKYLYDFKGKVSVEIRRLK